MKNETKAFLITLLIIIASMCSIYYFGAMGILFAILGVFAFVFIYFAILFLIENL